MFMIESQPLSMKAATCNLEDSFKITSNEITGLGSAVAIQINNIQIGKNPTPNESCPLFSSQCSCSC